jgi:soluble lytic murein transglycosylase
MKFFLWRRLRAVAAVLILAVPGCPVRALPGNDVIVEARDAYRARNTARLATLAELARGHELAPYVEYWRLALELDRQTSAAVAGFLRRHDGSVLAERLRSEWLKALGRSRQWAEFEREYPLLAAADQELACYALHSRMARRDAAAYAEAKGLWLEAGVPSSCAEMLETLAAERKVNAEEIWQRERRLLEGKRTSLARSLAAYLPTGQAPDVKAVDKALGTPERYLHHLKPNFSTLRRGRELAMVALARMARNDALAAMRAFVPIRGKFLAAEREYVYGQMGWQGALQHLPEALAWYKAAGDAPMTEEQIVWKARAALRAGDWRLLRDTIDDMPPQLSTQPDWIYWRGRALAALGRADEARLLYRAIAGQPSFYSNLADEELGHTLALPARAASPAQSEIDAVAGVPGIRRALALFDLDLRWEAVREWNWSLRDRDDRFLLAAAEYARRKSLFDRAINTADRTQSEHDFDLRYLAPFRERVEPRARELALDEAWVYGLMRQESRFVMDARSSVGARGLMQLMPATARWVARHIGLRDYARSDIHDMDTNVILGTNYLKIILGGLDNHPVLASAAYNAGPGRARRWRDSRPMEGAIYVETIPFGETRDYVKRVMSNTVYYAALFGGKPQSLKARLGVVNPGTSGDGDPVESESSPQRP